MTKNELKNKTFMEQITLKQFPDFNFNTDIIYQGKKYHILDFEKKLKDDKEFMENVILRDSFLWLNIVETIDKYKKTGKVR